MKRILLSIGFLLGLTTLVSAQCAQVSGINSVPVPGITCPSEPIVTTYGATGVGIVPASTATDLACITGSATKTIRLQYVRVSGSSGTLINVPITLVKRASADTGGTAALTTALPVPYSLDSANAAASATTIAYTANPTIVDSSPGILDNDIVVFSTTGTASSNGAIVFDYTGRNYMQAPILRGIAQQLCVNLNATTVSTGLVNITFRWTEAAS